MSQLDKVDNTGNLKNSSPEQYRFKNKLDNETYSRLIEKRDQIFMRMGYKVVSLKTENSAFSSIYHLICLINLLFFCFFLAKELTNLKTYYLKKK